MLEQKNISTDEMLLYQKKLEQSLLEYIVSSLKDAKQVGCLYQQTQDICANYLVEVAMFYYNGNQSKASVRLGLTR